MHLHMGGAKGRPVVEAAVVSKPARSRRDAHICQTMSSFKLFRNFFVSRRSCRLLSVDPSFFPLCINFRGEGPEDLVALTLATCPPWPLWPCVKFWTCAETTKEISSIAS